MTAHNIRRALRRLAMGTLILGLSLHSFACANLFSDGGGSSGDGGENDYGSITVRVREALGASSTIEPGLDMEIHQFLITLTNPGEAQTATAAANAESVTINDLVIGSWTVRVDARNEGGVIIASGTQTVTVAAGETTTTEITAVPVPGEGTLSITVSWLEGQYSNPSIAATLTPTVPEDADGVDISSGFSIDGNTATYSHSRDAGYYLLSLKLLDDGAVKWERVVAARIIAGRISSGTFGQSFIFTVTVNHPEDYATREALAFFATRLGALSEDRMTVTVEASSQNDAIRLQAVKDGTHTMTTVASSAAVADDPRFTALSLPYLFKNRDHFLAAMSVESGQPGDTIISGFPSGTGIVPIALFDTGARNLFLTTTPTSHTVGAFGSTMLSGKTIRVVSSTLEEPFVEALEGTPVALPFGVFLERLALENSDPNKVHGAALSLLHYHGSNFHSVAKNYYLDEHMRAPEILFMNAAVFNGLSSGDKDIVRQAAKDTAADQYTRFEAATQAARTAAVAAGATMFDVSDADKNTLRTAVQSLYENAEYNTAPSLIEAIEALRP